MPRVEFGKETVAILTISIISYQSSIAFAMNPQILSNTPLSGESKSHNK
jgi:hypothetical protein